MSSLDFVTSTCTLEISYKIDSNESEVVEDKEGKIMIKGTDIKEKPHIFFFTAKGSGGTSSCFEYDPFDKIKVKITERGQYFDFSRTVVPKNATQYITVSNLNKSAQDLILNIKSERESVKS